MTAHRKKLTTLMIGVLVVLFISIHSVSAQDYTLVEPIPGIDETILAGENAFLVYLRAVFNFSIGAAALLAVLMIVIGGVQYTTSYSSSGKGEARQRILNAVLGLLLVLGAWVILYTINPKLVRLELTIPCLIKGPDCKGPDLPDSSFQPFEEPFTLCQSCAPVSDFSFPAKTPSTNGCKLPGPCQVNIDLGNKLAAASADSAGTPASWLVSEMYPPTRQHQQSCHQDGTCVDVSLGTASRNSLGINTAITIFEENGLRPVYEVSSRARYDILIQQGVSADNLRHVDGITGEHFSIYND